MLDKYHRHENIHRGSPAHPSVSERLAADSRLLQSSSLDETELQLDARDLSATSHSLKAPRGSALQPVCNCLAQSLLMPDCLTGWQCHLAFLVLETGEGLVGKTDWHRYRPGLSPRYNPGWCMPRQSQSDSRLVVGAKDTFPNKFYPANNRLSAHSCIPIPVVLPKYNLCRQIPPPEPKSSCYIRLWLHTPASSRRLRTDRAAAKFANSAYSAVEIGSMIAPLLAETQGKHEGGTRYLIVSSELKRHAMYRRSPRKCLHYASGVRLI